MLTDRAGKTAPHDDVQCSFVGNVINGPPARICRRQAAHYAGSMRLGFISLHTSPLAEPGRADAGGMNVVVHRVACQLARLGHDVEVFTRRSDPTTPDVQPIPPIDVAEDVNHCGSARLITLPAGAAAPLAKSAMEQAIEPFSAELHRHLSRTPRFDLLHSHHWFSGIAALPIARAFNLPHVQSFHSVAAPAGSTGLDSGEPSESPGRIAGERAIARDSDVVVAVSDVEAATIRERYGARRIEVARPGVGVEFFRPRTCPTPEHPYLLFAARLQPLKGADLAIDVFRHLRAIHPDLHLIIAGDASADFGQYAQELRAKAGDAVEFVGACDRDRLACLMRNARLFVLPSWSETFGLVALESQASGVPVIGWRGAGGLAEAIAPGGLLMDDRDPARWAAAVTELLTDDDAYRAACRDARDFACTHTWQHTAQQLVQIYRDILAARAQAAELEAVMRA